MKRPRGVRIGNAPGGNYLPAVELLGEQVARHGRGTVTQVRIAHDEWCGIFHGRPCDCDPDVSVVPAPEAGP